MDWTYLFFSFDGRIGRQPFWLAFLVVFGLELACYSLVFQMESGDRLGAILSLAFTYPEFAVWAKRGQDRNISPQVIGAFFLFSVLIDFLFVLGLAGTREAPSALLIVLNLPVMLFGVVLLIELGFRPGTRGPNRFGRDPLA